MIAAIRNARPASLLNAGFLLFLCVVTAVYRHRVEGPVFLAVLYGGLLTAQVGLAFLSRRGRVLQYAYNLVLPTVSILLIFDSLGRIVHQVNPRDIDHLLIRMDYLIFGTYPTVALERVMSPLLSDILQLAYSSYYFLPIILGARLLLRRDPAFDRALFLIMLCFYLSYVGYILAPAIGPRFTMDHLQTKELEGWILAGPIQEFLNRLEGIKRDAFPSGHTGIALTVLYLAYKFDRRLFPWFLPFVGGLVFATVYCRYHYVVDVLAGVLLTVVTVALGEWIYGWWTERDDHSR